MVKIKELPLALSFDDVLLVPKQFYADSRADISLDTTLGGIKLKLPIIAANMPSVCEEAMAKAIASAGGLGIIHRMQTIEAQVAQVREVYRAGYTVGAAVGIGPDYLERAKAVVLAGAQVICIDVAHGFQRRVVVVADELLKKFTDCHIIIGNLADFSAAAYIRQELNVSINQPHISLKMGVGGGSMCTTRIQTGAGVPTLHSIFDASKVGIPLIADGGIRTSGDIVKSLAAGASAVMLGSLLAGTDEAPGDVVKYKDKLYKVYRGAASHGAKKAFFGKTEYIEGEETLVPYKGSVLSVLHGLSEGIKSGLSYCGSTKLSQLTERAEFIRISAAGLAESKPHGV